MKHIAFTGHRPKDLGGHTQEDLYRSLNKLGVGKRRDIEFITGGALGTDTWAAEYAIDHGMPLRLITPFTLPVMTRMWTPRDRERAHFIASMADRFESFEEYYDVRLYDVRNRAMVDNADCVFAVWSGKHAGGTADCIRYALSEGKPVYNLFPFDGRLHPVHSA